MSSVTAVSIDRKEAAERRPTLLIVGCGYLGKRVAAAAERKGWRVLGSSRRDRPIDPTLPYTPIQIDWNDSRTLQSLPAVDAVVVAVSYDRTSGVDREESQVGGLRRLLKAIPGRADQPSRLPDVLYISTTGVYHQRGGQWVDESSPTHPLRDGGAAHLRAEAVLRQQLGEDSPWTILRMAGLYGPGRVPRAADVIAGRPIASPPLGHLNLIHIEDAAAVTVAALERPGRRRLYVVSDDRPVIRGDFYRQIAMQAGAPEPRFVEPPAGSGVQVRSGTDKRVWNRRMKRDLMPRLLFPTCREGLRDVLAPERP